MMRAGAADKFSVAGRARAAAAAAALLVALPGRLHADTHAEDVATVPVPEPSSLLLLGGALAGGALLLAWIKRRRR